MNINYDYGPTVFVNCTRERLDTVIISRITVMGLNLINNRCVISYLCKEILYPWTTSRTITDGLGAGRFDP